ncbi:MAG: cobyric acid synthase [Gemmatimonadales bacterium]|nr:MAG: cobyric acid synthase [Gemmatimonadales bacterium]
MVQGTTSGAGKSLLTAALCRILARRGIRIAPFKAQNMSNNAAVTVEGGEIGRAQALQARAAGVQPEVRMNPVLLKPLADTRSEVVLLGRGAPDVSRLPWRKRRPHLWPHVTESLDSLRRDYDLVVVEGAGSPAEINLRDSDIVNMAVARHSGAAVLLVTDIDRGGAFATLFGTWALLEEEDRALIKGFVLNRFRGDPGLLAPAPRILEERTGVPTVGIVPWMRHLLPEEDGGPRLATAPRPGAGSKRVGAIRFPHISNVDDLDPLRAEPDVQVVWVSEVRHLFDLDGVILPGSRNTLADLAWMAESGLGAGILALHRSHVPILGLCGGYQMMGSLVRDPHGVEEGGERPGLGILPLETTLAPEKETVLTRAHIASGDHPLMELIGHEVEGYEIHHGHTRVVADDHPIVDSGDRKRIPAPRPQAVPWLVRAGNEALGHAQGSAWGCYLHGLLENPEVRAGWLREVGATPDGLTEPWARRLDRELDQVAHQVEAGLDLPRILDWVGFRP